MKLKELKSKLKWSRKKTWIAAAALLVLAISFFMFPKEGEGYDYLELKEGPYTEKVLAVGQMGLQGETSIIAQVRGTVQSLGGKDGETLPEGSLLLSIYDPDHEFLLAQKESGYLDAREQYNSVLEVDYPSGIQELNRLAQNVERARKDAEDAKILLAEGAISQNAYSDYQNALLTAETLWKSEKLRVDALAAGGSKRESLKYRMENAKALYDSTALQESDFNIRAGLDTMQVYELLRQINRDLKMAFLIVTHDRHIAEKSDRIIEMKDGKILRDYLTAGISEDVLWEEIAPANCKYCHRPLAELSHRLEELEKKG